MNDRAGHYDEFSLFHENASEVGLPWNGPPTVRREFVEVAPGRRVSALVWGTDRPEAVFLHGGGQNAHTWDTVALALDRPLVAIDLPGHGHSDWPGDEAVLDPRAMAEDVAAVIEVLAPSARMVVGMSLGGVTSMALARSHPGLVRKLALVDITPGVTSEKSSDIAAFLAGPESFASFDEILQRTIEFNPTRSESSLFYKEFFQKCHKLLADDGVLLLHSIGRSDGPGITDPWLAKHIFPGGYIPALSEVLPAIERAGFLVTDVEILRLHYADTLKAWRERFSAQRDEVAHLYDERFCRMWELYLVSLEMAFREEGMMVFQIQMTKAQEVVPNIRDYIAENEMYLRSKEVGERIDVLTAKTPNVVRVDRRLTRLAGVK